MATRGLIGIIKDDVANVSFCRTDCYAGSNIEVSLHYRFNTVEDAEKLGEWGYMLQFASSWIGLRDRRENLLEEDTIEEIMSPKVVDSFLKNDEDDPTDTTALSLDELTAMANKSIWIEGMYLWLQDIDEKPSGWYFIDTHSTALYNELTPIKTVIDEREIRENLWNACTDFQGIELRKKLGIEWRTQEEVKAAFKAYIIKTIGENAVEEHAKTIEWLVSDFYTNRIKHLLAHLPLKEEDEDEDE